MVLQDVGLALRAGLVHLHRSGQYKMISRRSEKLIQLQSWTCIPAQASSVQDGIYALGKACIVIDLDLYTCTGQLVQEGIYALGKAYRAGLVHLHSSVQDGIYAFGKAYRDGLVHLHRSVQLNVVYMRPEELIELDLYTCRGQFGSVQDGIYALGKAYRAELVSGAV